MIVQKGSGQTPNMALEGINRKVEGVLGCKKEHNSYSESILYEVIKKHRKDFEPNGIPVFELQNLLDKLHNFELTDEMIDQYIESGFLWEIKPGRFEVLE